MRPVLRAVLNAEAELVFFPLFQPEGNHLLLQARRMAGFERILLMSDGALIESSFIEDVQSAAVDMLFVAPSHPKGPAVDALADAYRKKFKMPPATSYYLSAYDAADLLFSAIEKTAERKPDGTLIIGRRVLRQALYRTKAYPGISGELTCNTFGDCAAPVFDVLRLEDPKAGVKGLLSNVVFSHTPNTLTDQKDPK